MTTISKNAKVKSTAKVATPRRKKVATPKVKSTEITPYKKLLNTYGEMKQINKTIGGSRSWLLSMNDQLPKDKQLTELQINILKATKKAENYKIFTGKGKDGKPLVRVHHATGNCSPFYVAQAIYKHESYFQSKFTF